MISNAVNLIKGLFTKAVQNTPIGKIHAWTRDTASNSKSARELLRLVVYSNIICMVFTLGMAFRIIMAGKMDLASATVVGGAFTLFGGTLAVTIPAFVTALNASDPNNPPAPPTPPAGQP